jgi:hypothetical protein
MIVLALILVAAATLYWFGNLLAELSTLATIGLVVLHFVTH